MMVLAKTTGFALIILGVLIASVHFGLISNSIFGIDVVAIGIFVFIAHEVYSLFMNFSSPNKLVSIGVPLLFVVVAASYFIKGFIPEPISSNILLIIAVLMCAEGLYRLH